MKLKCLPEDFQVEELTHFTAGGGPFALYQLTKRSLGTPEAIDVLARRWNVPRQRLAYGGLKDKHALTRQYVTLQRGPRGDFEQKNLEVKYLGQTDREFGPHDISGNRFRIVMRDMSSAAVEKAVQALEEVRRDGLPNYFDDQRFGSVGESREFIGQAWCAGNFERALWLALADAHEDDRADEKEQKRILREKWGSWRECKEALERSNRRSIITYLADKPPDRPDYRGAFARMRVDLRSLYLSAFQSYLWNRVLAKVIRRECPPESVCEVMLKMEPVPFFQNCEPARHAELTALELPLPSSRLHLDPGPMLDLLTEVVGELGLELRQLRVKYPRDSFFSKGSRKALVTVPEISHEPDVDEMYPGRHKLTMNFDLPRGSYATILVKRLTEC